MSQPSKYCLHPPSYTTSGAMDLDYSWEKDDYDAKRRNAEELKRKQVLLVKSEIEKSETQN